jgi:hypothetical protein
MSVLKLAEWAVQKYQRTTTRTEPTALLRMRTVRLMEAGGSLGYQRHHIAWQAIDCQMIVHESVS